jgi:hypothetical protein
MLPKELKYERAASKKEMNFSGEEKHFPTEAESSQI